METENQTTLQQDIDFVKSILPEHYQVKESAHKGSIHCKSREGLRFGNEADDDEHWGYVYGAIKNYFGDNLNELDFNTNAFYQDFTIYISRP